MNVPRVAGMVSVFTSPALKRFVRCGDGDGVDRSHSPDLRIQPAGPLVGEAAGGRVVESKYGNLGRRVRRFLEDFEGIIQVPGVPGDGLLALGVGAAGDREQVVAAQRESDCGTRVLCEHLLSSGELGVRVVYKALASLTRDAELDQLHFTARHSFELVTVEWRVAEVSRLGGSNPDGQRVSQRYVGGGRLP